MTLLGKLALVAVLTSLLTACGSSPPVRYYSLGPANVTHSADAPGSPVVGLGPLRMPDYLKRPQIVSRGDGSEVNVDDFARWAEPMDDAMHGMVATYVDSLLDDVIVIAYPYISAVDIDYYILGRVDQFDTNENGEVVLSLQWTVVDSKRQSVIEPQRERYETQAASLRDPGAISRAMNELLARFSRDISEKLGTELQ